MRNIGGLLGYDNVVVAINKIDLLPAIGAVMVGGHGRRRGVALTIPEHAPSQKQLVLHAASVHYLE